MDRRRARSRNRHSRGDTKDEERRPRSRERAPRPRHRSKSRHRSTSRRRSRSTVRCGSKNRDDSRDYGTRTRDPVSSKAILNFPYGIFPRNWRFAATITDIQAGHWGAQSAYFVQVDLSIERYEELENFSFSLWLVPILASGERDPGADVKHYGPQDLEGEVIVVHHNRERGGDAGINAGAGPAGLNASGRGNNTTAFDIKVSGGLKTTCSPDKGRHKMFSQVYENKKSKKGVPNKVRLYAVVVCPDAVALDVSAEVEVVWKKGFVDYVSTLKCPVIGSGFWRVIALPELQEDDEDYKVWKSEKYKQKAANDCVTGISNW